MHQPTKKKILAHSLPTMWMDAKHCFDLRTLFLSSSIFQLCKNVKKCLYNKKWTLSSYSFVFVQFNNIVPKLPECKETKYISGNASQQLVTKRNLSHLICIRFSCATSNVTIR